MTFGVAYELRKPKSAGFGLGRTNLFTKISRYEHGGLFTIYESLAMPWCIHLVKQVEKKRAGDQKAADWLHGQ